MRLVGHRTALLGLAACVAVAGLAACGSSSKGGSATAPSSGGSSSSASPIKIAVIASQSAAGLSFPETVAAVQARVNTVNAAGGINGAKIEVVGCDDKNNPNTAAACAREAVSQHVVATVGDYSFQGEAIWPILTPAGIPRIGLRGITPTDSNSPLSFPIDGNVNTAYSALAKLMIKNQKCTGLAVAAEVDSPATEKVGGAIKAVTEAAGVKWAGANFGTPTGTIPDLTPVATKLVGAGATCIVMIVSGKDQVQFSQAFLKVKPDLQLGAEGTGIPANWPTALPGAKSYTMLDNFAPLGSDVKGVQQFLSEMKQYSPNASLNANAARSWVAADVFVQVAKMVQGPLTPESLVAALNKATNIDTGGLTAPISFTTPYKTPGVTREFNTKYIQQLAQDGKVVASGEFFDVAQS